MRPTESLGRLAHSDLVLDPSDHHAQPVRVTIDNTSQSITPGTDYNLDIPLGAIGFTFARVMLMGPKNSGFGSALWRECADVHVTATLADAIGHSIRDTGSTYKVYGVTYAKAVGATNLSHKIFDNNTASGSRYIALKDAQIIGSMLRLTFHNYFGGSATLWVKGEALVW